MKQKLKRFGKATVYTRIPVIARYATCKTDSKNIARNVQAKQVYCITMPRQLIQISMVSSYRRKLRLNVVA